MTSDDLSSMRSQRRIVAVWAATFVIGMFGVALVAKQLPIAPMARVLLMILPMLLLIPMVRSIERAQEACGTYSPALRRYNRRALGWSFSYVLALIGAIWANQMLHPEGALAWAIAIVPSLPLLFFIWSMGRYLVEETDEYLRQRTIVASLWATGILLAVASCYGFLETFKLVPHVEGWAAVPVWALGLAIGNLIMRRSA